MDNHAHLLAKPPAKGRIGQMMQRLGRNYVAQFNGHYGRLDTIDTGEPGSLLAITTPT